MIKILLVEVDYTSSLGFAVYPLEGEETDGLLRRAQEALTAAQDPVV